MSAFYDKGKKTARGVWRSLTDLTLSLQLLSCTNPTSEMIEIYTPIVLKLYGVKDEDIPNMETHENTLVDSGHSARLYLFLYKGRDFEHIPPTSAPTYTQACLSRRTFHISYVPIPHQLIPICRNIFYFNFFFRVVMLGATPL